MDGILFNTPYPAFEKSRLPEAYQEVEYIQGTGNQYIKTGYTPNANTSIYVDYQYVSTSPVSGYWATIIQDNWVNGVSSSSNTKCKLHGKFVDVSILNTSRHKITLNSANCVVDGTQYNYTGNDGGTNGEVWILRQNGSSNLNSSNAKIYKLKMTENGVVYRNLVPCYRKSDNVAGFYNLAYDGTSAKGLEFYTNAGTGSFIIGEPV